MKETRSYHHISQSLSLINASSAALILLGWPFHFWDAWRLFPDTPMMKVNSALALLCLAVVSYQRAELKQRWYKAATLLLLVPFVLAFGSLTSHITGWQTAMGDWITEDYLAASGSRYPGRMSAISALLTILMSVNLMLFTAAKKRLGQLRSVLLDISFVLSLAILVAYLFDANVWVEFEAPDAMSIAAASLFLSQSWAISMLHPKDGVFSVFYGNSAGNKMARRLFAQIAVALFVFSYLRKIFRTLNWVSTDLADVLVLSFSVAAILYMVSRMAVRLNREVFALDSPENQLIRQVQMPDSSPDKLVVMDTKGIIVTCNQQTSAGLGYSTDELRGRLLTDFLIDPPHQLGAKGLAAFTDSADSPLSRVKFLAVVRRRDGSSFPAEIFLSTLEVADQKHVTASLRNISGRNAMEEEMRAASERLELAVRQSGIGIWEYDVQKGTLNWDENMLRLYGTNASAFDGRFETWLNFLHPRDAAMVEERVTQAMDHETDFEMVFRILWSDDSTHYIRVKARIFRDSDGVPMRMLGANWDVTDQKEVESKLQKSLEQSIKFVSDAPTAMAMFDNNMQYLAYSRQWIKDYGLGDQVLTGKSHYEVFPDLPENWKEVHRACLQGATMSREDEQFVRANGEIYWLHWHVQPWYNTEGAIGGVIMFTRDITEFRNNLLDRFRMERILHKINDIARIGTWEIDMRTRTVFWTDLARELHGVSPNYEPTYDRLLDFFPDGIARDRVRALVAKAVRHGQPWDEELQLLTADGRTLWARHIGLPEMEQGRCVRIIGIVQDIDERKRTEQALLLANEELSAVFNTGHVAIFGTDVNGIITMFSKGAEQLMKYRAEDLVGKADPRVFYLESEMNDRLTYLSEELKRPLSGVEVFTTVPALYGFESHQWTFQREDGSRFPVQLVVTAQRNAFGKIIGFIGVAIDVTEVFEAQREINSLLHLTTDQNTRLRNFAHIVSHNLRSHSSNFGMLLDIFTEMHPEFGSDEAIQNLYLASRNLKDTIAHLNDIVLINTTTEEALMPVELRSSVAAALKNLCVLASESDVELINNVPEGVWVLGVQAYIDSIFLNFVSNAIKYRGYDRSSYVRISADVAGEEVLIGVEDNGLGIDMKTNGSRLFGMYKTFHNHRDSRGIGLFITKNQIEAMGGTVGVESTVNVGTTFKIKLRNAKN